MILDQKARALSTLACITVGLVIPSAAMLAYGLIDALDNEPAAFIRDNKLYNRAGTLILDLGTAATGGTTSYTITGIEAGNASLILDADESDDDADQWTIAALAASSTLKFSNLALTGSVQFASGAVSVIGEEGGNASIVLSADEADDTADSWTLTSEASGNTLQFINGATLVAHLASTGLVLAANKNASCATGTTALDLSLGTGVTKTTTGTNTIGGNMIIKAIPTPVAATGAAGGVAGAAALGAANELYVSSDGATKGVKLLTGVAGDVKTIHNTSSTACNLFAASGGTINGGAADAGCAIPASKGVRAHCSAADTWTVYDLTAKAGAAA